MSKKQTIPAATRKAVFDRFSCCAACGTWDAEEVGHLVAEANGGNLDLDNLVRLCDVCNKTMLTAHVVFKSFALEVEDRKTIVARREYFKKYCRSARGSVKIKPYQPLP